MTRLLHFADLHLDAATAENTRPACAAILDLARRERPDLIVNAGDLSMKRGHLAPWVALALRELHVALAEIAPVIVVAGNHDLATAGSEVGTVMGALARAEVEPGRLSLFERPGIVAVDGQAGIEAHYVGGGSDYFADAELHVACLPYPSKAWLLAQRPEVGAADLNATLSALLLETLHGLAAQIPAGERAILVYHGSIAGARTDSEQTMTTEMDLVLAESDIPACFEAVLCGHIHRPQQIGRAVYSGSPAPLTFAEERSVHGCTIWTTRDDPTEGIYVPGEHWKYVHRPLPVAHPLRTYDLRPEGARERRIEVDHGARCRVRLTLKPGEEVEALRRNYSAAFMALGAHEVKVEIERAEEARVAGPEVSAALDLEALLGIYCERHPEARDMLPALEQLAGELEGQLSPEARMEARAAGYELLRLEWSNWKSYGEGNALDLESLGRLVAIEGENASGKSNAAELEAFALYGRFIRGDQALSEAVRIGADEAKVVAIFEAGGERWKVERRIRVNSKGRGSQDLALARWASTGPPDAEIWAPAALGTARETQAFIERLVGPFALYLQTRFASQGQIDSLLNLTPSELKDVLQQALATGLFAEREALARPALQAAERAAEKHEAGLVVWRDLAAGKRAHEIEVDDYGIALAARRSGMEKAEAAHAEASKACEARRGELEEIGARVKAWEDSGDLAVRAIQRVTGSEASIRVWNLAIQRGEKAIAERAALPEIQERLRVLRTAEETRRQRRAVVEAEARALSTLQREAERIVNHRIDTRASATFQAKNALDDATRRAGMIARAPFGEKCVDAACPFIADAAKAHQDVPRLTLALEQAKALVVSKDPEAEQRIAAQRVAVAEAQAALDAIVVDELELRRLAEHVARLEALEPAIEEGRRAQAKKELAEQELPALKAEAERLAAAHGALGEKPSAEAALAAFDEAAAAAMETGVAVEHAKSAVDTAVLDLSMARARLDQATEAEAKLAAAAEEGARLEAKRRVAAIWLSACGRDGLPFLMLERALPALESHANHFLCADLDSGLRLEIDGLRELQSGDTRSEVVVRYTDEFGTHSLAGASGMQGSALGLSLRVALAQVQAEAHGFTAPLFIMDEAFEKFSPVNLVRIGQPMLRRLADRVGRVFVISQEEPILAICDSHLRVEADHARGSRLVGGDTESPREMEMAS